MVRTKNIIQYWPALLVLIVSLAYAIWRLSSFDGDPVGLAQIGTRFQDGDPSGSEGYDGQFAYYIAQNPNPAGVRSQLDVPAYRYQRILYPLLARALALKNPSWIPWALLLINLGSQFVGTLLFTRHLIAENVPTRYALIYGLWVGLIVGVGADLFEPLAFALIAAAWLARSQGRWRMSYLFLLFALLTKEIAVVFWLAALFADLLKSPRNNQWKYGLLTGLVFFVWQLWLWIEFGEPGLASGGAMATGFEIFPYFGLLRIVEVSLAAFILFTIVFGPTIVLPSILGFFTAMRRLMQKESNIHIWALLFNSLLITFLPHSTFREPLGLLRVATGMVFSITWYAVHYRAWRPLNYAMFWIAFLALIVR